MLRPNGRKRMGKVGNKKVMLMVFLVKMNGKTKRGNQRKGEMTLAKKA